VRTGLGATSLATIIQMVANAYGVTLLPEVSVNVEIRDERIKLLRFVEPEPSRTVGLAWRRTSPRKADFIALGQSVIEALNRGHASARPRNRSVKVATGATVRQPRAREFLGVR
jgi:DNA-binding transcriptional LysR family regulator